MVHVLDVVEMK